MASNYETCLSTRARARSSGPGTPRAVRAAVASARGVGARADSARAFPRLPRLDRARHRSALPRRRSAMGTASSASRSRRARKPDAGRVTEVDRQVLGLKTQRRKLNAYAARARRRSRARPRTPRRWRKRGEVQMPARASPTQTASEKRGADRRVGDERRDVTEFHRAGTSDGGRSRAAEAWCESVERSAKRVRRGGRA